MDLSQYVKPKHVEEPGHFYGLTPKGETVSAHTILGKNGKERAPTLRDIKACNLKGELIDLPSGYSIAHLVKSVTSLERLLDRPGLTRFKNMSLILGTEEEPRNDDGDDAWYSRVTHAAGQHMREAADLGTRFHHAMEHGTKELTDDIAPLVEAARAELDKLDLDIVAAEESFVARVGPFGGTIDVVYNPHGILDYKTRTSLNTYETDLMQIAAYGVGYYGSAYCENGQGISLIASTKNPGETLVRHWSTDEIRFAWRAFRGLLDIWCFKSNYHE